MKSKEKWPYIPTPHPLHLHPPHPLLCRAVKYKGSLCLLSTCPDQALIEPRPFQAVGSQVYLNYTESVNFATIFFNFGMHSNKVFFRLLTTNLQQLCILRMSKNRIQNRRREKERKKLIKKLMNDKIKRQKKERKKG